MSLDCLDMGVVRVVVLCDDDDDEEDVRLLGEDWGNAARVWSWRKFAAGMIAIFCNVDLWELWRGIIQSLRRDVYDMREIW